jgi:outer membrane protein assembly factor BamA
VVVAAGLRGEWHDLGGGKVGGKPDTGSVFPGIFAPADDTSLGWLELEARYDTRDSQRQPYRGFEVGVGVDAALLQTGWETGAIFKLAGSKIFPLPPLLHDGGDSGEENPPTDTLAFHLQTRTVVGDLPFYALPSLGGERTLRGFIAGRFRDESAWNGSIEYRFWVLPRGFGIPFTDSLRVERLGLAFFGDLGSVARDWSKLFDARLRPSAGISFRAALERGAPFRVDVGFSKEDVQVSAGFGLPF